MTNTMMELMKDIWLNKIILRNNTWQLDGDAEMVLSRVIAPRAPDPSDS